MSTYERYRYNLQKELRRQEYLTRIRQNTQRFQSRFQDILDDIVRDGLNESIPEEFSKAKADLSKTFSLLNNEPERARDLCQEIGSYITGLRRLAREVQRKQQELAAQRAREEELGRQKAGNELDSFFRQQILDLKDPTIRDFAYKPMMELRKKFMSSGTTMSTLNDNKNRAAEQIEKIRREAAEQATAWKSRKLQENQTASRLELLEIHKSEITEVKVANPGTINGVLDSLEKIKIEIKSGKSIGEADFLGLLQNNMSVTDEAIVDERCRKQTVQAVIATLTKTGFLVEQPRKVLEDGKDVVVIRACKRAGQQANFKVTVDGSLLYKFENYEGQKCKDDVKQVLPVLEKIYGIELSEHRVLWENPDKLTNTARPVENSQKTGGNHGK